MNIKKRKVHSGESATTGSNGMGDVAKKSESVPMSVSAALGSLKVKGPSATTGQTGASIPSAKTESMDTGHSEAYKERIKKRAK
jgi:hypothetical protein